jgi:hypothetical protein
LIRNEMRLPYTNRLATMKVGHHIILSHLSLQLYPLVRR